MRKFAIVNTVTLALIVLVTVAGCKDMKRIEAVTVTETSVTEEADSMVYGTCGLGTAMNTLELITDGGDTIIYSIERAGEAGMVLGGLLVGDRMAVMEDRAEGRRSATKVINITSLMGRWNNLNRSFQLCDSGRVKTDMRELRPYTEWKLFNGKLILAPDTFDICFIGKDSLYLKDVRGTHGFRRLSSTTLLVTNDL